MIRIILIAFLFFNFYFIAHTQSAYTIGNPFPAVSSDLKHYFSNQNELLVFNLKKQKITLQKFDLQQLREISRYDYEDFSDNFQYEKITRFGDRYFLFYSVWNKKQKNKQLYYWEIDFEAGCFIGHSISLITIDRKQTLNGFVFNFSNDHSKMLITYRLDPVFKNSDKNYDVIGFYVFNDHLENLWHTECNMPYSEKKITPLDYSVDYAGHAYMLTSVYNDNTTDKFKKETNEVNYHIEIFTLTSGQKEMHRTNVLLDDKLLHKLWIVESPGDYMLCAGIYSTKKSYSAVDGICTFKLRNGEIIEIRNYDIPKELLQHTEKEKYPTELQHWNMEHLRVEADGSMTLAGEVAYRETVSQYDSKGRTSSIRIYHHDDIVVARINNATELQWMRRLYKRQASGFPSKWSSYKYISTFDNDYFIFLDAEHNTSSTAHESLEQQKNLKGSLLSLYKIEKHTGAVTKTFIVNLKTLDGKIQNRFSADAICPVTSEGEGFVMEINDTRKTSCLIRVSLEKTE